MKEPIGHIAASSPRGSALILTVVLTSLLAIVGVLFVMATRIDKMGTAAVTESRELNCAVDTVLAQIERALVEDLPGLAGDSGGAPQEYYDFPDDRNPWLADLEPYKSGTAIRWRQITNLVGTSTSVSRDLRIRPVGERARIDPNLQANPAQTTADADGDGIGDARWFRIPDAMTSKGKPYYAAVRIVDNGGMLNVNTGFRFDPNDPDTSRVNGASPLQVNVLSLAAAPGRPPTIAEGQALLDTRANRGTDPAAALDLPAYERDVIWQYLDAKHTYTPFDMSDELELRYRHVLDQDDTDTRVEDWGWFRPRVSHSTPMSDVNDWFFHVAGGGDDPNSYLYRHIATTYNMDRIITPALLKLDDGTTQRKMVNVNIADDVTTLRSAIRAALRETAPTADPNITDQTATQIAVNLRDCIDDDDEVTVIGDLSSPYYGFERPCVYLSELACRQKRDQSGVVHSSYAIELHRPYFEDKDPRPGEWKLKIGNTDVPLDWTASRRFHVVLAEDTEAPLGADYVLFQDANEPANPLPRFAYSRSDYTGKAQDVGKGGFDFTSGTAVSLWRSVPATGSWFIVDFVRVPDGWIQTDDVARSIQRDISPGKCVRRLWAPATQPSIPALGNSVAQYVDTQRPGIIQAHPANQPLTNIGELGMIFRENVYNLPEGTLAENALVDLGNPAYSRLFTYLTVIDPSWHLSSDPNNARIAQETRIMGRININTAPAPVLAQLPWLSYGHVASGTDTFGTRTARALSRAREIVRRREAVGPYASIGELMQIGALRELAADGADNGNGNRPKGPDLTADDTLDDFEERDLLFTRISDLVTVRSDVFTAYILVRIGVDGPQRRIIAVLDRSRADSPDDKVRLVALHPVPDPR